MHHYVVSLLQYHLLMHESFLPNILYPYQAKKFTFKIWYKVFFHIINYKFTKPKVTLIWPYSLKILWGIAVYPIPFLNFVTSLFISVPKLPKIFKLFIFNLIL